MANRYWAAGVSGNWNNTASWSSSATGTPAGASVPGSSDAAIFNAASGTVTATLDISPVVQTLTMTGFTGTLAFGTNTISLNSTGTIFTGSTTTTVTGTPLIICTDSSATARTISPGIVTEANSISFNITAGTGTVTLTTNHSFKNVDYTGFTGIWGTSSPVIFGNLTLNPSPMSVTAGGTVFFQSTSGTKTITTNAVVVDKSFTFNGVGGTWQLQDALTSGNSRTCTLTAGTLDLNGYTLSTGLFASTNSNTRTLAFGTGKIVTTGTNVTIFNIGTSTNMTVSGTNPLVEATGVGTPGQTRAVAMGRTFSTPEAYSISLTVNAGADLISFTGGGAAFRNVSFVGFTGTFTILQAQVVYGNWNFGGVTGMTGTASFTFAATSGTKTLTSNSVTFSNGINFDGVGGTWQLQDAMLASSTSTTTLTNGTLNLNNQTLTTGVFSSSNSNTRVLAFGTGKIVATGVNTTVVTFATSTGLSYTGTSRIEVSGPGTLGQLRTITGPSTVSGGTEANALNLYVTAGGDTVTLGTINRGFRTIDFTGFTGTLGTGSGATDLTCYGDFKLPSGMSVTGGSAIWVFAATSGAKTVDMDGLTVDVNVTFNGIGGVWAMQNPLTLGSTRALTMTNGTLQLKSGTTNVVGTFVATSVTAKSLQATTPGSQATISQASGTVTATDISIQDSNATGGAVWNASNTLGNVNLGNNTGWQFSITLSSVFGTGTAGTVTSEVVPTALTGVQATTAVGDLYPGWYPVPTIQSPAWTNIIQS